ncbi:MAG: suppressor of fused domain protein [Deltaproteobacteria bacterium]
MADGDKWFENAWAVREEKVYPSLFGPCGGDSIYPLDQVIFEVFKKGGSDPRWLTHGVIKFPPTEARKSWLFVTSGLSNAWEDKEPEPEGPSGLGCELVMETCGDFGWALFHLRRLLAYQTLLGWGRYEGKDCLGFGDRIPLQAPIDGNQSLLTWCLVVPPAGYPPEFQLPSGRVTLLHIVGVTDAEIRFAGEQGYPALLRKLSPSGYPVTDASRDSVV